MTRQELHDRGVSYLTKTHYPPWMIEQWWPLQLDWLLSMFPDATIAGPSD